VTTGSHGAFAETDWRQARTQRHVLMRTDGGSSGNGEVEVLATPTAAAARVAVVQFVAQ
jgi:hypothetical protein